MRHGYDWKLPDDGSRGGMMQMNPMNMSDAYTQDADEMDEAEMPAEVHAH